MEIDGADNAVCPTCGTAIPPTGAQLPVAGDPPIRGLSFEAGAQDEEEEKDGASPVSDVGDAAPSAEPESREASPRDIPDDYANAAARSVTVPVRLGPDSNQIVIGTNVFRFAFWNITNFTGEPVRQGAHISVIKLDLPRNILRFNFIVKAVRLMNLDCLALMELGSDGEQVLAELCRQLNAADTSQTWEYTFSPLTGPAFVPPEEITIELNAFRHSYDSVSSLAVLLGHYKPEKIQKMQPYLSCMYHGLLAAANRHRDAASLLFRTWLAQWKTDNQQLLLDEHAKRIRDGAAACKALAQGVEDFFRDVLDRQLAKSYSKLGECFFLTTERALSVVVELCGQGAYVFAAVALTHLSANITLKWSGRALDEEGSRHALSRLDVITNRYERYGLIFRTGLHVNYLEHTLVETALRTPDSPTNSRAALSFNLPLGAGQSLRAYLIHSMFGKTPTVAESKGRARGKGNNKNEYINKKKKRKPIEAGDGENQKVAQGAHAHRIATLVAHAKHARASASPPAFIIGDTNITRDNIGEVSDSMMEHGYTRLTDANTSLRQVATIWSADSESPDAFFNEPYDAVYQSTEAREKYHTDIEYPFMEFIEIFQAHDTNNAFIDWHYRGLVSAFNDIVRRLNPRRSRSAAPPDDQPIPFMEKVKFNLGYPRPGNGVVEFGKYVSLDNGRKQYLNGLFLIIQDLLKPSRSSTADGQVGGERKKKRGRDTDENENGDDSGQEDAEFEFGAPTVSPDSAMSDVHPGDRLVVRQRSESFGLGSEAADYRSGRHDDEYEHKESDRSQDEYERKESDRAEAPRSQSDRDESKEAYEARISSERNECDDDAWSDHEESEHSDDQVSDGMAAVAGDIELRKKLKSYLNHDDETRKFFAYFHHFISDHRPVLMAIQYRGLLARRRLAVALPQHRSVASCSGTGTSQPISPTEESKEDLEDAEDRDVQDDMEEGRRIADAMEAADFSLGDANGRDAESFLDSLTQQAGLSYDTVSELFDDMVGAEAISPSGTIDIDDERLENWLILHQDFGNYRIVVHGLHEWGFIMETTILNDQATGTFNIFHHRGRFVPMRPRNDLD